MGAGPAASRAAHPHTVPPPLSRGRVAWAGTPAESRPWPPPPGAASSRAARSGHERKVTRLLHKATRRSRNVPDLEALIL